MSWHRASRHQLLKSLPPLSRSAWQQPDNLGFVFTQHIEKAEQTPPVATDPGLSRRAEAPQPSFLESLSFPKASKLRSTAWLPTVNRLFLTTHTPSIPTTCSYAPKKSKANHQKIRRGPACSFASLNGLAQVLDPAFSLNSSHAQTRISEKRFPDKLSAWQRPDKPQRA